MFPNLHFEALCLASSVLSKNEQHASERVQVRPNGLITSPGGGGMDRSSEAGFVL